MHVASQITSTEPNTPGWYTYVPGVMLVTIITVAAYGLRQVPGLSTFSPMIAAIVLGALFANFVNVSSDSIPGVKLMGKRLLRVAVALLGLQLTVSQIFAVGFAGMSALALLIALTYAFTLAMAKWLGVDMSLARLIGAGTAVCGASAIAAADSIDNNPDENVAYAVGCITLFGTAAMLLYPVIGSALNLDAGVFGYWSGATIHEVAQVVATGYQYGPEAGETAVLVKLSRVLLLAPLLIGVAALLPRQSTGPRRALSFTQILPVFVIGFMVAVLASSFDLVPHILRDSLIAITPVLLTAALGALGLGTTFRSIRSQGIRPLALAALATVFISGAGLVAAQVLA